MELSEITAEDFWKPNIRVRVNDLLLDDSLLLVSIEDLERWRDTILPSAIRCDRVYDGVWKGVSNEVPVTVPRGVVLRVLHKDKVIGMVTTQADIDEVYDIIAKSQAWNPPAKDKVAVDPTNPLYHKNFYGEMEWIEALQHHPRYNGRREAFIDVVDTLIIKYIDRLGGKDDKLQELKKAEWYLYFLLGYLRDGVGNMREAKDPFDLELEKGYKGWLDALQQINRIGPEKLEVYLELNIRSYMDCDSIISTFNKRLLALRHLRYWISMLE